jgi:hypothetical protein
MQTLIRWDGRKTEMDAVIEVEKFLSKKLTEDWWSLEYETQENVFSNQARAPKCVCTWDDGKRILCVQKSD